MDVKFTDAEGLEAKRQLSAQWTAGLSSSELKDAASLLLLFVVVVLTVV